MFNPYKLVQFSLFEDLLAILPLCVIKLGKYSKYINLITEYPNSGIKCFKISSSLLFSFILEDLYVFIFCICISESQFNALILLDNGGKWYRT